MDEMIDALLYADMIEKADMEGTGDFLFEAFLVPKPRDPTGPPRLVVDYSPLKHCFDRHPFKQTDPFTILSALKSGYKNFFVADMKTGYWQIRLIDGPDGSHITAFVTERGIFRWKVMPMGIQPATDELSHQMQDLFGDLFATEVISEGSPMVRDLDDFLGGARTEEELCELMEKFLARCQAGGVYLNPTKFNIALDGESVIFAGIKVGSDGYSMDPARLDAIREFPHPRINKELQRWLGLCTSLGPTPPSEGTAEKKL